MRERDVAITFIRKRVEAPFYRPRDGSKPHFTAEEALPVLRVKRNRTETFHNVMERDCPRVHRPVFATVASPSEAVREHDVSISLTRSARCHVT